MEENKLHELLEKYWQAETTTDEERLIEQYIAANDNDNVANEFFIAKRVAKNVVLPAHVTGPWNNIRQLHHRPKNWLFRAAAVLFTVLGLGISALLVKQHHKQTETAAAAKQLEADLNVMFNVVNDSYKDVTSSAEHFTK